MLAAASSAPACFHSSSSMPLTKRRTALEISGLFCKGTSNSFGEMTPQRLRDWVRVGERLEGGPTDGVLWTMMRQRQLPRSRGGSACLCSVSPL